LGVFFSFYFGNNINVSLSFSLPLSVPLSLN